MGEIKLADYTHYHGYPVGRHEDPDGGNYLFISDMKTNCPIVKNIKTGKWFILPWCDILQLAQEAGIDTEDAVES